MNKSIRRLTKGLPVAALLTACAVGEAKDVQVALRTGLSSSDNISRVALDPQSDTIAEVGLQLSIDHQSRRLAVNALGDFAYQDYLRDSYDDEVTGYFNGEANLWVVPDYFSWTVGENFGQTRQDLSAGITPGNRENINTFETGPDVTLPLPGSNQMDFFGRYTNIDYEETLLDSERNELGASLTHLLSKQSSIGIHFELEEVEYDDLADLADFDSDRAFLRYEKFNDRNSLTVDGGVARIEGAGGEDDGPLVRISATRQLTSRNMLWVELSHEFSDAGLSSSLYADMPTTDPSDQALSRSSEPFTSDFAMIGWSIQGRRTDLQISGAYSKETYATSNSDRVRDELNFNLSRALGSGWTAELSFNYDGSEFESTEPDYTETTAGLAMEYRLSRRFYFETAYTYTERGGDLSATNYSENRLWVRVRYGDVVATDFGPVRSRVENKQ